MLLGHCMGSVIRMTLASPFAITALIIRPSAPRLGYGANYGCEKTTKVFDM